jgi:hypothetical protein
MVREKNQPGLLGAKKGKDTNREELDTKDRAPDVAQRGRGQEDEPQAQVSYFTCVLPLLLPNAFLASGSVCAQRSQGKGQNKNPIFLLRNPL